MTETRPHPEPSLRVVEWEDFRTHLPQHREAIERMVRLSLSHDARRMDEFGGEAYIDELGQRAVLWVLEHATEQPAEVPLSLWLRKVALTLLDEDLEREAMANGGLYHSRTGTIGGLLVDAVLHEPHELHRWLAVEARTAVESHGAAVDPPVGSVAIRARLVALEESILRLPEMRRRAVSHFYFDRLSSNEIAFLLDTTVEEIERELLAGRKGLWLEIAARD